MEVAALRALEFDRIVESVRSFALTPMGDDQLALLSPNTNPQEVAGLLAGTSEAVHYIVRHGVFPIRGSADLPDIFSALAVEGRALEATRLLTLATFLDSVDDVCLAVQRVASSFPRISRACAPAAAFKGEIAQTRKA